MEVKSLHTTKSGNVKEYSYHYDYNKINVIQNDNDIDYQSIHCGSFKILYRLTNGKYRIKFNLTGYEKDCDAKELQLGIVKDPYYPQIFGVGAIGIPDKSLIPEYLWNKIYNMWRDMIKRCYDPSSKSYPSYGAIGVHVCDRWKILEYFVQDVISLPNYHLFLNNPHIYQLDKDQLQFGNDVKIYSPETCMFVSRYLNCMISSLENKDCQTCNYIGVYQNKNGEFVAKYKKDNKTYNVGVFKTAEAAAQARDSAVLLHRNIPDQITNDVQGISYDNMKNLCIYGNPKYFLRPLYKLIEVNQ